jgi:hypothetical protein
MVRAPLSVAALCLMIGCGRGTPVSPQSLPSSELTSAPTRVVAGGKSLTLTASLWRDFMPISPPDGKPLIAVMQVRTDDGSPVPAGIAADTSWVIYGDEVWSSFVEPRPRSETGPIYEVIARNGPKWGPGVTVDVVVRLRDSDGRVVLLRAEKQTITATQ